MPIGYCNNYKTHKIVVLKQTRSDIQIRPRVWVKLELSFFLHSLYIICTYGDEISRLTQESFWMKKLKTLQPEGLNTQIDLI